MEAQATKLISEKEEAKRLRELRKREAIERSQSRQANPEYFAKILADNRPPEPKDSTKESLDLNDESSEVDTGCLENEENFDPFKRKSRR